MQKGEIRHCTYEKEVKICKLKYIQDKMKRVNIHPIEKTKNALK